MPREIVISQTCLLFFTSPFVEIFIIKSLSWLQVLSSIKSLLYLLVLSRMSRHLGSSLNLFKLFQSPAEPPKPCLGGDIYVLVRSLLAFLNFLRNCGHFPIYASLFISKSVFLSANLRLLLHFLQRLLLFFMILNVFILYISNMIIDKLLLPDAFLFPVDGAHAKL